MEFNLVGGNLYYDQRGDALSALFGTETGSIDRGGRKHLQLNL